MTAVSGQTRDELSMLLDDLVLRAAASEHFAKVWKADGQSPDHVLIVAEAKNTPEPVYYRLEIYEDTLAVSWCSPDRYISQSIETDILWTGDDLDDLIDEELVDLGWNRGRLKPLKHFRNDEMLFAFISGLPITPKQATVADTQDILRVLEAYAIAFSELGDMAGDGEDE